MEGKLIAIEGLDGIGKTTTMRVLSETLQARGVEFITPSEYAHPHSESIRALLNEPKFECTTLAEALLFFASRANHYSHVIAPALAEGKMVLLDRYIHSTLAYQGDLPHAQNVYACCASEVPEPDLVLCLDMDYSLVVERMNNRGRGADRIEQRDHEYFKRVQQRYRSFVSPKFRLIDANQPTCSIVEACLHHINSM